MHQILNLSDHKIKGRLEEKDNEQNNSCSSSFAYSPVSKKGRYYHYYSPFYKQETKGSEG